MTANKKMKSLKFRLADGVIYVPFLPASKEIKVSQFTKAKLKNDDLPAKSVNITDMESMQLALNTLKESV